ncbi:hypothetical protein EMWEY_00060260, partial [Eimeria maxima]
MAVYNSMGRVEKVSVGVLVDLTSIRVGGGGLYVGVGVCCSVEGEGSVPRVAVSWLSDACSAWCKGMVRRTLGYETIRLVVVQGNGATSWYGMFCARVSAVDSACEGVDAGCLRNFCCAATRFVEFCITMGNDFVWGVLEVVTKKETVCLAMQKECIG